SRPVRSEACLSEGILRSHLDQARRVNGAVDLPEGARSDAHKRGLPERWMIEYVEVVTAQVQRVTLMEFEVLGQGHVPVLLTWPPESIAGHVAKAGRRVAQSEVR